MNEKPSTQNYWLMVSLKWLGGLAAGVLLLWGFVKFMGMIAGMFN